MQDNEIRNVRQAWNDYVPWFIRFLFEMVFYYPLSILYFHGPQVFGIGFWQGMSLEQICAHLTNERAPSSFWSKTPLNRSVCQQMVENQFHSFLILVLSVLYFLSIFKVMQRILNKICR